MQTFNLDLSNKEMQPRLNAKQGEVGRTFLAVITDGSTEYEIPAGAKFSIWYSGAGGEGNYTDIGDRSAFNFEGNKVTVELITQMLNLPGKGELCLTMEIDGYTTSTWNIPYLVEAVPGMGSKEATQYYNILKESAERAAASAKAAADSATTAQQAAEKLETDESLSASGVAADAKATGERLATVDGKVADLAQEVLANSAKIGAVSIVCDAEGDVVTLKDAAELPLSGLKIFGKTTQNGTPTVDASGELVSTGDSGSIGVKVSGRNLLNLPPHTTRTTNGINFTPLDGGVRLVGTSTATYAQNNRADHDSISLPAGTYTLKMEVSGNTDGATFGVMITKDGANSSSVESKTSASKTIKIEDGYSYGCFVYMVESGKTVDCVVKAILVPGEEAPEWEPYIEPQTASVSTPNGLPGIPVSNGGNYTDESGQQWLAHVAGYVQDGQIGELVTTGYIESYAEETIRGAYLSSTGGLDVGASVRYALETPGFVPYAADVQEQWRTLRTNKLNTTIYNDCGAWMRVSYAADTKAYIDNKFNELAAAIVNNT